MAEQLGQIERPDAERFSGKRKLFLVPLVYEPPEDAKEGQEVLTRYWEQVQSQVASLESKLGVVRRLYHEALTVGGPEGLERVQTLGQHNAGLVREKWEAGAELEATEDEETFLETVDLQRILSLPLSSRKVAQRLQEWFSEGVRSRYEHIARRIDQTLKENEVGLLIISERHQVQFPAGVEVFYVSPPALDEFNRWLQRYVAELQKSVMEQAKEEEAGTEPQQ